jgi:hypothetical protein
LSRQILAKADELGDNHDNEEGEIRKGSLVYIPIESQPK